jgi:hypothetical protein
MSWVRARARASKPDRSSNVVSLRWRTTSRPLTNTVWASVPRAE